MSASQKESVVLYPSTGVGHLLPMIELAKLFVRQDFSVTILLLHDTLSDTTSTDTLIDNVSSEHPSISFHRFPKLTPPPNTPPHLSFLFLPRLADAHLRDFLASRNDSALVLDMFCSPALDVAEELSLPSYFFFTSGAFALAAFLVFPDLHSQGKLMNPENGVVNIPGLRPIRTSDMPDGTVGGGDQIEAVYYHFRQLRRSRGILINTFEHLEKQAVAALADGGPATYCIGPLITRNYGEKHECMDWLDAQPERSVVFLCFGSAGRFSEEQMKETALGLERSGQRFLWVVRDSVLPEGFLERTRGRGLVVRTWVPQTQVLGHKAVGAFVSHCGWNSALEAVSAGVGMVAWPMYAEQKMNKVVLEKEAEIAVAVEGYNGVVKGEEVERKVRWVMETEEGMAMRERMAKAKEDAKAAWKDGGSSVVAWMKFVGAVKTVV